MSDVIPSVLSDAGNQARNAEKPENNATSQLHLKSSIGTNKN